MNKLKVLTVAMLVTTGLAGCQMNPSKAHIIRVDNTGDKIAIDQNPATGFYELNLGRVQSEVVTVPVFFTNGEFKCPTALLRYEANGHSAIFGNAATTSTIATGSNAVATALGGGAPPINIGTGTSNNLTYSGGTTTK